MPVPLQIYAITILSAFCLYFLYKSRSLPSFSVLKAINVDIGEKAHPSVIVLDALVTSILGATIAYFVAQPTTTQLAATIGLSYTGIINAFASKNE